MASVIVIDDSLPDQRLAETLLRHAGHTVTLCGDGQVGLDMIKTQRPDGSWANPENLVKEDDPLIATPLAVRALVASSRD